jgi:DNA-binding transcriptional LysR family regulator
MSLQQLEQFVAVAEERHFTRAALRCHIAQSALSMSIRSLEHELGAPLFIRSTRRVELSETGRALLPEARRVLAAADSARDAVDQTLGGVRGNLTIGSVWGDVSQVLAAYHAAFPDVKVTLKRGLSLALINDVLSGEVDVAFVGLHPQGLPPGIRVVSQRSVPVGIACSVEHRLGRRKKISVRQLSGEVFVADPRDAASLESVSRFFAECGVDYQVAFRVADIPSMLELVANGLAIALLPKTAAESWPGISYVPLAGYSPSTNAGIITSDRALTTTTRSLLDVLNNSGRFETAH